MSADAELVRDILASPGERWFAGLAAPLARSRWETLASAGLNRGSYGTVRFLAGDAFAPREDLATLAFPEAFATAASLPIEALRGKALDRYATLGLDFHGDGEMDLVAVGERLREALNRIARVPAAAAAVGAVLAALHVVRPEAPDYDVGYSDPDLPFSIFVGIEGPARPNGDLRLAEGILHECMHLQLSLIESVVPLVAGRGEHLHSPWQGRPRPIQSILHGLYVFRVVQDFHRALLGSGRLSVGERAHLERRVRTIEDEAMEVGDLSSSRDLTPAGRQLAALLLAA